MFKAEAAMRRLGEGSVTYRMKSSTEHKTVTFLGSHITVAELRKSIMQHMAEKIKKDKYAINPNHVEYELRLSNAESQEVYNYELTLIPSGTFLIVSRVPISRPISSDRVNSFGLGDVGGHTLTMTMAEYPMDDSYSYFCLENWINDKIGCPLFYQYDPYIPYPSNNKNCTTRIQEASKHKMVT